MMQANGEVLDALRSNIHGELIEPEHPEYEAARRVWNADIDRRPAVIARCESVDDVRTAVLAATEAGLEIAVRGGAHSFPGYSVGDGALVIDLSRMNRVSVDAETRRARVAGRCAARGPRRRGPGARPGHPGGNDQSHRRRRPHPWRRNGLALSARRPFDRQPRLR